MKNVKYFLTALLVAMLFLSACKEATVQIDTEKELTTLDLTIEDAVTGVSFNIDMVPHTGSGPFVFHTKTFDPLTGTEVDREFVIPAAPLEKLKIKDDGMGGFALVEEDGTPTGWTGTYTKVAGPAANEITYSGFLGDGSALYKFTGITDPAPLVIIAVAGIGAAVCALIVEVTDCSDSQSILNSIAACRENNGKPQLKITTTFGIRFSPFNVGCGTDCEFECL